MTTDDGMDVVVTETPSATIARQAAEIERLRAQLAATEAGAVSFRDTAEAEFTKLRGTLREIRIHLHAAGRRPEECYEMSLIDEALGGNHD